jgi:hypothetical protein
MDKRLHLLAPLLALGSAACSSPAPMNAALEQRAKAAIVARKPVLGTVAFQRAWLGQYGEGSGLVCGRIDPPAALSATRGDLRFIYEDHSGEGFVEYHEAWIGPATGMALLNQNRKLFDELWEGSCAPAEPSSWTANLFG